jgi:inhibitor of KinA
MNSAGTPTKSQPQSNHLWEILPYGEDALLLRHPDCAAVAPLVFALKSLADPRIGEIVPSYGSILVLKGKPSSFERVTKSKFREDSPDSGLGDLYELKTLISTVLNTPRPIETTPGKTFLVPCCYEMGPDLQEAAQSLKLTPEALIRLHSKTQYTIYAVGFQPGFPYAGWLPPELTGLPRRGSPRTRVEPGSVGITGRQTGIYPGASPGGWNLIGVTPCKLVDLERGWFAFTPGDRIRFVPIDPAEFAQQQGSEPDLVEG